MHPSFEQFVAALRDPSLRSGIGLVIGDADAAALLTRQDWATDYYDKWLALFPVAAASAASPTLLTARPPAEPVTAAESTSSPFGPPPVAGSAVGFDPQAHAPIARWKRPITGRPRIALIIVGSVLGLVMIVGYALGKYHEEVDALAASHPVAVVASPRATQTDAPTGKYGLTGPEYQLMDAVLLSQNQSVDGLVAKGVTESQLRVLADQVTAKTAKTCTDGKALPNGFDNVTFRTSFIAGYVVSAKATPDQAGQVYAALATFCLSTP